MAQSPRRLKVLSQTRLGGNLRLLAIERDAPFRAGQLLGLSLPPSPGESAIPQRLYSIASGEGEAHWELLYSVEEEGALTPRLSHLEPGDAVLVEGPSGNFASEAGPAVWVGGGTGIAPFVSLARSGKTEGCSLIHAASRIDLFYCEGYFEGLFGPSYFRCCSRADEADPRYFRGRATEFIAGLRDVPQALPWLLCGGSEFVVTTREALIARGIPYARILSEVYF